MIKRLWYFSLWVRVRDRLGKLLGFGLKKEIALCKNEKVVDFHDDLIKASVYLYWWKENQSNGINLGDYLSKVIVQHFAPSTGDSCDEKITIYGIGSILGFRVQNNVVVWGTGFGGDLSKYLARAKCSQMDIRAVRGPQTYKELTRLGIECPKVFGDPGILMPLIYQPTDREIKFDATVIPHYTTPLDIPSDNHKINVVSMLTTDYKKIIDSIVKSRRVISGSLHGIILAEAYGVSAVLVRKRCANLFKYKDYYYSTERKNIVVAHSVKKALRVTPMPLPQLEEMQKKLVEVFPRDLWEN